MDLGILENHEDGVDVAPALRCHGDGSETMLLGLGPWQRRQGVVDHRLGWSL